MALRIPDRPHYFVTKTTAERNTSWHEGSICWVTDENKMYVLTSGSWVEVTSGLGTGSMTTVKEAGVQVGGADIVTLDFDGDDFNTSEDPNTEVNITINDAGIDHDSTTNFAANEHFLQTAITNVSTALSTGLLKVTTGTGALSAITDSSSNWNSAYSHVSNDGSDHSKVTANETAIGLNTTHRGSNGTDHSYIDQDVTSGSTPTFSANNFSDGGTNAIITTTQETNFETAYTHSQDNTQAHSDYLLNSGDDTTSGVITMSGAVLSTLNATATSDITLFGTTDVGDDVDGKKLLIHRKAAEGDNYIEMYINAGGAPVIDSSAGYTMIKDELYITGQLELGQKWWEDNLKFRHYGYITADTVDKYVDFQINDATDYYELTREDSYVLGFDIQMPLVTDAITASGLLTISNGQIAFPASVNASADPNTLDDYEEGTWTVTVTPATSGTVTVSTSNDTAAYVKIGNFVFVHGRIVIDSVSSPVGTLRINLPFTVTGTTESSDFTYGSILTEGIAWAGDYIVIETSGGVAYFQIREITTNGAAGYVDGADIAANDEIRFSLGFSV